MTAHPRKHRWKSSEGEKRSIAVKYQPSERILKYLTDMRSALAMTSAAALTYAKTAGYILNPIQLRAKVKPWFDSAYGAYAKHHINPVCRTAVALLRSYRKRHKKLGPPQVRKLAMRIDSELFRVTKNGDETVTVRITLKPFDYEYITFTPRHKKWSEYSNGGKVCEILLTEGRLCFTFTAGVHGGKPLGERLLASDVNFQTIDSTAFNCGSGKLESVSVESLKRMVRIQNDFSRRRRRLQLHVRNPAKRARKLRETRGRQRNRVKDTLQKLSTNFAKANPGTTFVFENLKGIRKAENPRPSSKKLRTYLNRWPYRMFQGMVEYKSRMKTLYVSPRGTSSECPVCGGKIKHPAWAISRCEACGVDYDRDRLASLAILQRGLRLCGQPFAVSASASWQLMKEEYLYAPGVSEAGRAGGTEAANAPKRNDVYENTHF